jgi:acyl-CoA hydrolase
MTRRIALADIPGLLRPGMTVFAPGVGGESAAVVEALSQAPEACAGVHFAGVWLPGINRVDYAGLHEDARATAFFVGRELHRSFAAGRIALMPLSYFEIYRYLRDVLPIDLAFVQVAPPDENGRLSLGIAHDFTPAILNKAKCTLVHINPRMPATRGHASLAIDAVDFIVEAESPLLADDPIVDPVWDAIARNVATLVRDGDTLELGIGRVQNVFTALTGARRLKIHSGAITQPLMALVEGGAIESAPGAITAGMALGDARFYTFCGASDVVRFAAVGDTHAIATLAAIPRFLAINSVVEVDLLGQANAEMVGARQVSGTGGIVDFMRGARLSPGGLGIIALPATSGEGGVSRVVAELGAGTAVSITRADIDVVVTEHGVADLRLKAIDARAKALIDIAAPAYRDQLANAWDARRRRM